MRERADRDEVSASRRQFRHPSQRDAAGDFGSRLAAALPHGRDDVCRRQVVEQHDVRACLERRIDFAQALSFDFDGQVQIRGSHALHRTHDSTGETHVVVLDQNPVVEPEAVIGAPTRAHGVLLQDAHQRRRLAGVEHGDATGGGIDELPRERCDSREPLNEVERRALADEQRVGPASHLGDGCAWRAQRAVTMMNRDLD